MGDVLETIVCQHGRKTYEQCPACPDGKPKIDWAAEPYVAKASRFDAFELRTMSVDPLPEGKGQIKNYIELDPKIGLGGAPTRATTLPTDAAGRKTYPIATGLLDFFPDALAAISNLSYGATTQHHPDKPVHWDRSKSMDEADTMMRHFLQRGTLDTDGKRHSVKMAWRALAFLQKELEEEKK